MRVEIAKEIFKALKDEDKIWLIEELMPCSGTYRQLDCQGDFSDGQFIEMANIFIKSDNWTKGIPTDSICVHDKTHVVNGVTKKGNAYEGIGFYSDDELIFIEDLEFIGEEKIPCNNCQGCGCTVCSGNGFLPYL